MQGELLSPTTSATSDSPSSTSTDSTIDSILRIGCVVVAFVIPLRLIFAYISLIPLIILWTYRSRLNLRPLYGSPLTRPIVASLGFFLISTIVAALVGLSPLHSARPLISLLFFSLTVPLFFFYGKAIHVIPALIFGQSLAALHSVIDASSPGTIPTLFSGKVTESGQLALTLLVTFGYLLYLRSLREPHSIVKSSSARWRLLVFLGLAATSLLTLIGFHITTTTQPILALMLTSIACVSTAAIFSRGRPLSSCNSQLAYLMMIQIPLLTTAFLVNLKRGPWLGVLFATSILCALYTRRLLAIVLTASIILAYTITPIRDRILDSYNHFTISGGRSTIWRIGAELAVEYPLGIGYHNSGILREFAPEIPQELKHFHNNILNIVTENGWISGGLFMWFLVMVLRASFSDRRDYLGVAIGCAIISWQIAGLVEYNFGDSEVMMIVWILVGLLLQRRSTQSQTTGL